MEECRNNGSHGICECKSGYYRATGSKQCEKDCEVGFCLNSGKCQQGPNGRVCICASGYSGNQCQKKSKDKTVVIVVCVIAAVLLVAFIAAIFYFRHRRSYHLRKAAHLDNNTSPQNSPGYPMKAYSNPRLDLYGDEAGSIPSSNNSPGLAHSFSNKVAAERGDENGNSGDM